MSAVPRTQEDEAQKYANPFRSELRTCGAKVSKSGNISYIDYVLDSQEAKEDHFTFDLAQKVVTWAQIDNQGVLHTVNLPNTQD